MANGSGSRNVSVVIAALFGLVLLIGGVWLATLGGSLYYLVAGVVLLVVAGMLGRRSTAGLWLYALLMIATVIWGLWEAGTDFWALVPRLDILGVLGLWLLIPAATRGVGPDAKRSRGVLALSLAFAIAVLIYSIFNDPQEINGSLAATQPPKPQPVAGVNDADWPAYGRTQAGTRYSPLSQINDSNVKDLQVAWTFRSGESKTEKDSGETTNELTPIKVGDNMFICTTHQILVALDPSTGKEKWRFDPKLQSEPSFQHLTCRGVAYYDQANTTEFAASLANVTPAQTACPRKVLLPVNDGRLFAINADNGQRCSDFAQNGELDLKHMHPYTYPGGLEPTSPPVVTGTTIIIGGSVTDNLSVHEPSGAIRGYDVNTGALRWIFDTGAEDPNAMPGEGQTLVNNSPNAWAPLAYDAQSDVVYIPTGNPTPDIWGGNRTPVMERYASAIVALNASTGKLAWSFQTTHHDLWDMDVPAQPTLAQVKTKAGDVPAVYVPTKAGNLFVLDRRDGKPIVPVTEMPVPAGEAAPGDRVSPTQPRSALNLTSIQTLADKDMWGATMFDQLMCRVIFKRLSYNGQYTPPSEQGTLVFPGNLGVFEWGGISVNPDRQVALMNPMALPFVSKLIPRGPNNPLWPKEGLTGAGTGTEMGIQPQYGVPYGVEINAFLSPLGLPCKEPAWGYVAGVNMENHEVVWRKRIGTIRDSLKGIQLPPLKIGVPMLGGPISTAGNVMFIAGTQDNYIRGYNVTNGDLLWQARLPAGGQATPMTYEANGKQYLVIMAGGHASFGTQMGDYLIAYALPK
ncbi:glucose/quinate/shikimate family membrane-bound PQQ-dependent dehydrogenase [Pseudomonas sp. Marseille-Q5115]|uniref:glucose/quinate/shikimate family membrane-bound PQQ-dependent dehydrogenase n=1 Tax=Pseudomonas sp. Marseille-Q5115 TaxID=2866593 RepID=UPI001CE3D4C7|nr:glucose/quinate/shikimate family membrane-bound PQQ-dependent dehydrogenase [Pseudomonas sp. Marseille-Q5115]